MKKQLFTIIVLLSLALGMQAQDLLGTWKTAPEKDEDGDFTTWVMTFSQNSQTTLKLAINTSDPEVGTIDFSLTMTGKYKRNGKILDITFDPTKIKVNIDKFEPTEELKELMKDPEMKKMFMDMLQKQVDEELKKSFAEEVPFDGALTIIKLTSTELVLFDDDEEMKLTRAK